MPLPGSSLRWINKGPIPVELLWYLRGDDNITYLQQHGVHFWDADADESGFLGMNYGLMTNFGPFNFASPICTALSSNLPAT